MKIKILFLLFLGLGGCSQNEPDTKAEKEVRSFVEQLKKGTYKAYELPDFNSRHIPELLKYRNDKTLINNYPANPISSFWAGECILGTYLLWNIESIRAKATKSKFLTMGSFPSLNPVLRKITEPDVTNPSEAHDAAAEAYLNWWNKSTDFEKIKDSNPLENTGYKWF